MTKLQKPAVVLLSGGLDSATVLAIAKEQRFATYAMTFRYGQRHQDEIEAATKIAKTMAVAQQIFVDIDLRIFGGSALTDNIEVPKGNKPQEGIPITYVPARNTIFLSFALAWAEVLGSSDIFIGANAVDYSGYPDCRPEFMEAFSRLANLATKAGVEGRQRMQIHTPLMEFSKAQIIAEGLRLGVDYAMTVSCYDPSGGVACGTCDACQLRHRGFEQNGMTDPAARASASKPESPVS